jgi:hypothetical protein
LKKLTTTIISELIAARASLIELNQLDETSLRQKDMAAQGKSKKKVELEMDLLMEGWGETMITMRKRNHSLTTKMKMLNQMRWTRQLEELFR